MLLKSVLRGVTMDDASGWIIIIAILLILFWLFSRRRRPRSNKLDSAIAVLSDINHNLKVVEIRKNDSMSKKNFRVDNWRFYKDRLEFLEKELVETIDEGYKIATEFKEKIDIAKKSKAMETVQDIDVERLKEPFTKGRQGIMAWLRANVNSEMQLDKRRNWFGF
jgi:hypothetical protein